MLHQIHVHFQPPVFMLNLNSHLKNLETREVRKKIWIVVSINKCFQVEGGKVGVSLKAKCKVRWKQTVNRSWCTLSIWLICHPSHHWVNEKITSVWNDKETVTFLPLIQKTNKCNIYIMFSLVCGLAGTLLIPSFYCALFFCTGSKALNLRISATILILDFRGTFFNLTDPHQCVCLLCCAGWSSCGSLSQTSSGVVWTHGRGGQCQYQHRAGHGCVRITGKSTHQTVPPAVFHLILQIHVN